MSHIPVLPQEVLEYLNAAKPGKFIDGTAGAGGHIREILTTQATSKVLGIDLDQASLDQLKNELAQQGLGQRCTLVQGNYKDLDQFASTQGFDPADGILIDLGFSSSQVDDPTRGFSFQTDGPLDMRYDKAARRTAEEVVNTYSAKELTQVIKDFGEEKLANRIAGNILKIRQTQAIQTTAQLADIVRHSVPLPIRFRSQDNIRRVFQAIRIEVNRELENLKTVLPKALQVLRPGGRLVIISFHSLEDRIVKEFFNEQAKGCVCPPEFPTCVCDKKPTVKILTRKPVIASETEAQTNPRSKSAKLRAIEKIN